MPDTPAPARFTPDAAVEFVIDLLDSRPEHGIPLWLSLIHI